MNRAPADPPMADYIRITARHALMNIQSYDEFTHATNPRRAFTLLELIVAVLMIGVLMALLFPALARSGDNGARTVCVNNLRQLGSALLMYGSDNNDLMAYPNWGTTG